MDSTKHREGAIDFPWIVEQLNAIGYEGDFALEYELHHPILLLETISGL